MAARIKLVVTGDMELKSLAESLKTHFPSERRGNDVTWLAPRRSHCATSNRLRAGAPPSSPMLTLARTMLAEAITGREGGPADLVIVVEDVELANLGQEHIVADHFRRAVEIEIDKKQWDMKTRTRNLDRIRECCSFHVFRPMPEAYFFGDALTLEGMGIPPDLARLRHPTDVESFEVDDPAWLPQCRETNEAHALGGRDWQRQECHPKDYLEHLLGRAGRPAYDETSHGATALGKLNWPAVPKVEADAVFARALFEDMADWFDLPASPMGGRTSPYFYPARTVNRAELLLRNM